MTLDAKTISIFLPVIAGCTMGLNYAMTGRFIQTISLPTWIFIFGASAIVFALSLHFLTPLKIDLVPALTQPTFTYLAVAIIAAMCAWIAMLFVTKNISVTYAAIGEISYPFFTALFTYLIFQSRELDMPMAIGGLLILIGSVIVITDKIKIGG